MWVKTDNGVKELETGHTLSVSSVDDARGVRVWEVISHYPGHGRNSRHVLRGGYQSENEARAALDQFLSDNDIKAVAVARPSHETEDEEAVEETD